MGKSVSHLVSYILTAILLELSLTLSHLNANFNFEREFQFSLSWFTVRFTKPPQEAL